MLAKSPKAPATIEKLLYRRKDAAYALSLSLRTIDTLIANQTLRTRRHNGCVFIPATEIRRFASSVVR